MSCEDHNREEAHTNESVFVKHGEEIRICEDSLNTQFSHV